LERILYSDGDLRKISWIIQTSQTVISQNRKHTENYKDKITKIQSKYVALHVALFWGIGTFNIKNEDSIKIKLEYLYKMNLLKIK